MPVINQQHLESIRLLVYVEQRFWKNDICFSTDEPFIRFLDAISPQINRLIYLARLNLSEQAERYVLNTQCEVWSVPNYESLIALFLLFPVILPQVAWQLIRRRHEWDAACICGPHLIGLTIALVCGILHRPYFFIVRENLPKMVQYRYPKILSPLTFIQARFLEFTFMWLGRYHPVLIVGDEVLHKYKQFGSKVRPLFVSLVAKDQLWNSRAPKEFLSSTPLQLLSVGRLDKEKGLTYLIDAVAKLIHMGKNVHLNIIGEGPERKILEAKVSDLSIDTQVNFQGYIPYGPQLLHFYRKADAFVLTSLSEGFPQVIVEAMGSSLPVVATRVGGIPQIVKHGKNGLLISPGSMDELVSAVLQLIEFPDLQKKLSEFAYQTAQNLTRESQAAVLINTLVEII